MQLRVNPVGDARSAINSRVKERRDILILEEFMDGDISETY